MEITFAELGLNEQILAGVTTLGFSVPTPVQTAAIPAVLAGKDVVASAQTGTGKTAAFMLPTLQRIAVEKHDKAEKPDGKRNAAAERNAVAERNAKRGTGKRNAYPRALIVTPTRELAAQIDNVAKSVCASTGQQAVIVTGGAHYKHQIAALQKGCDVLVATPGRLIDLLDKKHTSLEDIQVLVLDEADRMLDMGFWPSVHRIMEQLPKAHQTLLFSATLPASITSTIDALLKDPERIEIARTGQTAATIEQHLCSVTQGQKPQLLKALIDSFDPAPERVLVFCRTKSRVDSIYKNLKAAGLKVDVMHADRPQKARAKALDRFRSASIQILVATDVMSRGIDIQGIDVVINFDVPLDPEDYVHRIGRTGRAGATGQAYTFMGPDEVTPLREIEYFTKALVPAWDLPGFGYETGRIILQASRSTSKTTRSMFSGSRARGRNFGFSGRYGRHT
ncbi:DEAD/DEAH box helicase domain protein [Lancefieldella parvula DSM 20469]|uniref:DEAD/DEAH box helicase domain protein n=1 Tax=Lancefieldella parvula (strain ATCC 33793 / DSM 20469 / CCUG 32760 / JCM 10300 / KCTC 3663 / VPI 0546 / 1246) TaxID=521095 RepID=C8W8S2_LANP1|nr:DEAD/DEAH box helicase domain protein [Lancefieldella parvula DSM 20469]